MKNLKEFLGIIFSVISVFGGVFVLIGSLPGVPSFNQGRFDIGTFLTLGVVLSVSAAYAFLSDN